VAHRAAAARATDHVTIDGAADGEPVVVNDGYGARGPDRRGHGAATRIALIDVLLDLADRTERRIGCDVEHDRFGRRARHAGSTNTGSRISNGRFSCDRSAIAPSRDVTPPIYLVLSCFVLVACGGNNDAFFPAKVDAMLPSDAGDDVDSPPVDSSPLPQVVPSNGGALAPTGTVVAPPNGEFSTTNQCTSPSILGACEVVAQTGGPELCVCRADRFTIGSLRVTGARALVLLAWNDVIVGGTLDVGASGSTAGAGSNTNYASTPTGLSGGAGGSYGGSGGNNSAAPSGSPALTPLVAGMRGQNGCGVPGGGGGGALQITAGAAITVTGTITAGGGGGSGGSSSGTCLGGAGGGSGGAILLEAPAITVTGTIAASGGGGGGGGSSDFGGGSGGGDARYGGFGGSGNDDHGCPLQGYTSGGDGGWGASSNNGSSGDSSDFISGCLSGTTYVGAGGGGGGVGRVRVNTATGCQCAGTFSPAPSIGTVVIH